VEEARKDTVKERESHSHKAPGARARWGKWLLGAGAALAISCGNQTLDNYYPIPPADQTTDGGGAAGDGGAAGMDGSVTDGGHENDGGTGGDGGTAGMDGSVSDGGSTADGGTGGDGGTAGMDGGVSDGGSTTDGGSTADGGSGDGGMAGMDGGDGGMTTDGGSGGDGGMSDGGGPLCAGVHEDSVDHATFPKNSPVNVGGYAITYTGPTGISVKVEIDCAADSAVVMPEGGFSVGFPHIADVPSDGMRITFTPHSKNAFQTIMSVNVENN
jgi:hypothetical protein